MNEINWREVYKIGPNEFPENPDKFAEPELIYSMSDVRRIVMKRMFPSPVKGALARFGKTGSQHRVKLPNKSKACDFFGEGTPIEFYNAILYSGAFNGIGVYLDTKGPDGLPWVMFHIDIRKKGFKNQPLIWIVIKVPHKFKPGVMIDKYRYPQAEPKFWRLLNDIRFFQNKQRGVERS